jgi:hypothetical protein
MTTFDDVPDHCRHALARLIARDGEREEIARPGIHSGNRDPFRVLFDLGLISIEPTPGQRKRYARITDAGRALQPAVEAWQAQRKAIAETHRRVQAEVDALHAIAPDLLAYVRERAGQDHAARELAERFDRQVVEYLDRG